MSVSGKEREFKTTDGMRYCEYVNKEPHVSLLEASLDKGQEHRVEKKGTQADFDQHRHTRR